jgi:tetratricopeptide (TPR) repeat protein
MDSGRTTMPIGGAEAQDRTGQDGIGLEAALTEPSRQLLMELCGDLRLLWKQAAGPSLRVLAQQVGLSKSQLGAILAGEVKRPPDRRVVHGLVSAIVRFAEGNDRVDRISPRASVEDYWRPRYAAVERAFQQVESTAPAAPEPTAARPPSLLPPAVSGFIGRGKELDALDRFLSDDRSGARIAVVSGTAGIGKTTLAIHWAHRVADHFPDGRLYVNLRGFDPSHSTVDTHDAIRMLLDALGVPGPQVPPGLVAQTSLYRSILASRRVLLILDNARDPIQVRGLLPASQDSVVIVTSRTTLLPLIVAEGAVPVVLNLLTPDEARELLVRRLGDDRVAGDEGAVRAITVRCANLPLALAVAAARVVTRRIYTLTALAADLADGSMDSLATDDPQTDVRAVFSWSYAALSDDAARLFRLLGLHPGPDISRTAAASMADRPASEVRRLLDELTDAHLLMEEAPARYALHDLMRAYAAELSDRIDGSAEQTAARQRIRDHYLHSAVAAVRVLDGPRTRLELEPALPGVVVDVITDHDAAMDWFALELRILMAAARSTCGTSAEAGTWTLAAVLQPYLDRRGRWADFIALNELAAEEASRLDDRTALAHAHLGLGLGYSRSGDAETAGPFYKSAADRFVEMGDLVNAARAYVGLASLADPPGQQGRALRHARRGYELYREAGDARQASALNAIGWLHAMAGEHENALVHSGRAIEMHQETGDRIGEAAAWDSVGYAHHHLGHHDEAIASYHTALRKLRDLGFRYHEAEVLTKLGDSYHAVGDTSAARWCWEEALTTLEELAHPEAQALRARLDPRTEQQVDR